MKILLAGGYDSFRRVRGNDPLDAFSTLCREEDSIRLRVYQPNLGLHLLAQNVAAEVTVLENHDLGDFQEELGRDYDLVGLQLMTMATSKVAEMMELCRQRHPAVRIVLGGPGIFSLDYLAESGFSDEARQSAWILSQADAVCRGDGVRFLREQAGDDPVERPLTQDHNPAAQTTVEGIDDLFSAPQHVIVHALGCPNGCDFCASSAAYGKQRIVLASADDCFQALKRNVDRADGGAIVTIIQDENLLEQPDFVRALGRLIQNDGDYGLRKVGYSTFASLRSLEHYDPEELLELGVANLFLGVESLLDPISTLCAKRTNDDVQARFDDLHRHGITTTASFILGWDFHNHDTIVEEIERLVALRATMYHINLLSPCPGTKLFDLLLSQGRIEGFSSDQVTCWTTDYTKYEPLSYDELLFYQSLAHRWTYQDSGSHALRRIETLLDGYEFCKSSPRPLLHDQRAAFFEEQCGQLFPILESCRVLAPNGVAAQRARSIERRYAQLLGPPHPLLQEISEFVRKRLVTDYARRKSRTGEEPRLPLKRTVYRDGRLA